MSVFPHAFSSALHVAKCVDVRYCKHKVGAPTHRSIIKCSKIKLIGMVRTYGYVSVPMFCRRVGRCVCVWGGGGGGGGGREVNKWAEGALNLFIIKGQQTTSTSFYSYVCGSVNWYIISAAATTLQSCIERGARSSTGYASNCSQSYSPFDLLQRSHTSAPLSYYRLIMYCSHV